MSYTLTGNNLHMSHNMRLWGRTKQTTLCVRDILYNDHNELKVQIRSDEYFALLANMLDGIADASKNSCRRNHPEVQQLINDLLYLQRHYRIIKK